jgi:hypothetical protein
MLAELDNRAERAIDWWRLLRDGWFDFSRLRTAWILAGSWSDDGLGWSGGKPKPYVEKKVKKKKR